MPLSGFLNLRMKWTPLIGQCGSVLKVESDIIIRCLIVQTGVRPFVVIILDPEIEFLFCIFHIVEGVQVNTFVFQ